MSKKHLNEYEEILKQNQLACWDRYVQCKVWYRELRKMNLPCEWILEKIKGKHYTLTVEQFETIKGKYKKSLRL